MSVARTPTVKPGDVLEGRYRILKTLGEGGMGTVFLAEHALIKRRVAVKLLHPELAADADVVERFMNEARAAGTLGHPNIVESTDMGFTAERVPYIVFEFLEGALLTDEIYRVGGFTVRRAVRIAQQIASALHAAHSANIVHRDLKSDNVFLTDKDDALDHVKVLDFGISRFLEAEDEKTRRGVVMGTPEFMSPEQITSPDQVDRRTDVYALGVILYEMLTARRPFSSDEDPRALLTRIVSSPPPPLGRDDVPHALNELILNRMLAKDPADRYPSMIDVEAALASYTTQAEGGGLRRSKTPTLPAVTAAVSLQAPAAARPQLPRPASTTAPPWHQGRPDTDEHLAASALPEPVHKRPWLLYSIAGAGVVVGAIGLVIGTRSSAPVAPPAPVVMAPPPVAPPAPPAVALPLPARPAKVDVQIESNAPGARVTFRRRVTEAPARLEINASDIVELVEVSAPGYKTERYWLTLDRPTRLNARLAKGEGLAEATEEETLIALGELTAPTAADPAAVASAEPPAVAPGAAGATAVAPGTSAVAAVAPGTNAGAPGATAAGAANPTAGSPTVGANPTAVAASADAVAVVDPAKARTVPRLPPRRKIGRAAAPKTPPVMPDPIIAAPLDGDPATAPGTDPSKPEAAPAGPASAPGSDTKLDSAHPGADGAKPDGAKPDGAKPDGTKPDGKLDGAKPDGKLDGAKPDGKLDGAKPDGKLDGAKLDGKLDGAKLDGAKPDGAKPDGAKPDGKPDGAKSDGAKSDGAKPDGAKPEGAKPNGAKPDGARSDGASPAKPAGLRGDTAKLDEVAPDAAAELAALKALVASRRADVERCFAEGRKTNKSLAGTIRLELQVGLDGKIKRVQPHATFDSPTAIACIVQAAINWQFPERTTGGTITVISPFTM
jgi:serine/threonine-protein kinase